MTEKSLAEVVRAIEPYVKNRLGAEWRVVGAPVGGGIFLLKAPMGIVADDSYIIWLTSRREYCQWCDNAVAEAAMGRAVDHLRLRLAEVRRQIALAERETHLGAGTLRTRETVA